MENDAWHSLAERRIREALEAGAFNDLAGAGKPLELDDLSRVPEELRASYSLLKSAGCLPDEMELKRQVARLDDLLAACTDARVRDELRAERSAAALRFDVLMEKRGFNPALADYAAVVARKLA